MEPRRLVIWEATHENGWRTTIGQRAGGMFVVVSRDTEGRRLMEVVATIEEARVAAARVLARGGHPECSLGCSEWAMRSRLAGARTRTGRAPIILSTAWDRRAARRSSH